MTVSDLVQMLTNPGIPQDLPVVFDSNGLSLSTKIPALLITDAKVLTESDHGPVTDEIQILKIVLSR